MHLRMEPPYFALRMYKPFLSLYVLLYMSIVCIYVASSLSFS